MKFRKDSDGGYNIITSLFEVSIGVDWEIWHIGFSFFNWYVFSISLGPCYAVFHFWRRNR